MVNRRKFIQQGSALGAILMLNPSDVFKMHKVLGIQLYTVRDEVAKNLDNAIAQVANAGYTHVELFGYGNRTFFGRSVKEMAELLKKNNLKSPSGHYALADMLYAENYNWESWKYLLEDARVLGNEFVVIPWLDPKHRSADDFKRIGERLNKAGEMSKAAGITTGYHNHDFEFKPADDGVLLYEHLLKATDPGLVKFEMDLYWVKYAGQDPIDWFKRYPKRFVMWHIKDMAAPTPAQPKGQTCEVGKGVINWKEIFAKKKLAGLEYAFVEQEQYTRPVFDCIRTSAVYMKKNLL